MAKEIRAAELKSIRKCCENYSGFINLDKELGKKMIRVLEVGIHNAAIDKANELGIGAFWDNPKFIELYSNIGYEIKINLDIESPINQDKEPKIREYFISGIRNFIIMGYISDKLKSKVNPEFLKQIQKYINTINPALIGKLNPVEINPYINQKYLDELEIRNNQKIQAKYSEMYRCNQCGNKKVQLREIQSRSLDESTTTYFNCLVCNHRWRSY